MIVPKSRTKVGSEGFAETPAAKESHKVITC
jgi:hypothetical protein